MSRGLPRHRDLPPRPLDETDLVPWLERLAEQLLGREPAAAAAVTDRLGVRLILTDEIWPGTPGRVGEMVAFRNTIWAKVEDGRISFARVDDW